MRIVMPGVFSTLEIIREMTIGAGAVLLFWWVS